MLDFPNALTTGQSYTAAGQAWKWDGAKWVSGGSAKPARVDVFNVRDFGAAGDGTTDDTVAIQAAVAAVTAAGGEVYFPPGTYLLADKLMLKSNTNVQGARGASVIKVAPAASWPGGGINQVIMAATNPASNISVEGLTFQAPYVGNYGISGSYCHLMQFSGVTNVVVRDCQGDGGGDFAAFIGCFNTLVEGCTATNVSNSAADHWNGTQQARVIGNYFTSLASAGAALALVQWTGLAPGGVDPATTAGLICIGNQLVINNANSPQAIIVNGHASAGTDDKVIIANNRITINAQASWGVLVTGVANNGIIEGNLFEGSTGAYSAVAVIAPATNWVVANNRALNWSAGSGGVFRIEGSGCSVHDNHGAGCSTPFLGTTISATTIAYGNDTGTGSLALKNVAITGGSAVFDGSLNTTNNIVCNGAITCGTATATNVEVKINGVVGSYRLLSFLTGSSVRWRLAANPTAEGGGNVGSDFEFRRYSDTQVFIDTPLLIARGTGIVTAAAGLSLIAATGPTIRAGAGAATGTQPSGSLWIRTDGSAGARLYVSAGAGTWTAVAGV